MKTALTPAQEKAAQALDKALLGIKKEGMALRVFDGSILVCDERHFHDPRYLDGSDHSEWEQNFTVQVGVSVNADGGSGV